MILEAAAWMLGALIGNAIGLVLGYRLGLTAQEEDRRNRAMGWGVTRRRHRR